MIALYQTHRAKKHTFSKKKWESKKKIQTLSFKNINHLSLVLFSGSAPVLLRYHYPLGGWKASALLVLLQRVGCNCSAWHIPCSASSLKSSTFQPVFSSVKIFKQDFVSAPFWMLRQMTEWKDDTKYAFLQFLVWFFENKNNLKSIRTWARVLALESSLC